ncbi:MAG: dihydroorotase [Bacteroidia bacterium]
MSILIKNATLVNEGKITATDILVRNGRIERIDNEIAEPKYRIDILEAEGKLLFPGCIDDQVHFREPGLIHKADIASEARAAVAGGTTSFMEMPNTNPQSVTQKLLEEKYYRASQTSLANYSFFMGGTNDNLQELLRTDKRNVCGIKLFMGSSTGNMLVDNTDTLEAIFSRCDNLIAIHSENEEIIRANTEKAKAAYGENIPMELHPEIRSVEACYSSTEKAIYLAKKHNTRLHVLHISTAEEIALFNNEIPLENKRITAEACVHHLWYSADDYDKLGGLIKCNPAIKDKRHKEAIFKALLEDKIDIIATDHAPHTWEEKQQKYLNCPSGLPLVQHSLLMMLDFYHQGKITMEKIAEKMAHAPAKCFRIEDRGFIREGYFADLVLVDLHRPFEVRKENIHYKCGWSPLEGHEFQSSINTTLVNGNIVYQNGKFNENQKGQRLLFT